MAMAGRPLLLTLLLAETSQYAQGQFGGGGFGGGGYNPPAPICPAFKCGSGEKAVGKADHQVWSYGCKDSGMNILSAGSLDPSNPFGNMAGQKSVDKCCVERDICKQTCGMTSVACHNNFQKCSQKICKGDQNCQLQAMMSEMMSEPYEDPDDRPKDYKYDPEESKCKGYKRGQETSCTCVAEDGWKSATEDSLKNFYGRYNPEKLDKKGEIKDVDEVWKKWKGKEPEMFLALTTKYKAKSVDMRIKPKPPPYKPPPPKGDDDSEAASDYAADYGEEAEAEAPPKQTKKPPQPPALDADDETFEKQKRKLDTQKQEAAEDEDYDRADTAKTDLDNLRKAELERLAAKKNQAIEDEDYLEAKRVKNRIAKVEL